MVGGTLTALNGGMFYTTNTQSEFVLHNVEITLSAENDYFLRVTGNSNQRGWGTSGANARIVPLPALSRLWTAM